MASSIIKHPKVLEWEQHQDRTRRRIRINRPMVARMMKTIDRALFVPDGNLDDLDGPVPIGYNATISPPRIHAMCLELLADNLKPGMRALDVGSGSGYLTACFAVMVGHEGRSIGVEHIPELVAFSIKNIEKSPAAPLLEQGSLLVLVGDGRKGWPEFGPYDAIHVGAAAPTIPEALIIQLKPGGRMVIPIGSKFQDVKVVDKKQDGSIYLWTKRTLDYRGIDQTSNHYAPLTSRDAQLQGY